MPIMMQEENTMMIRNTLVRLLAVTASAWAIGGVAHAEIGRFATGPFPEQTDGRIAGPEFAQRDWRALSPEQKVQRRQEIHERLAALTPEQRQQMRQQMREHWRQAPPDQRDIRREAGERRQGGMPDDRRQWREERRQGGERGDGGGRGGGRGRN
jgi:hypothetical protein